MRFKCVCKSWFSLIRNPFFVNAHQNYHNNNNTTNHLFHNYWQGWYSSAEIIEQSTDSVPVTQLPDFTPHTTSTLLRILRLSQVSKVSTAWSASIMFRVLYLILAIESVSNFTVHWQLSSAYHCGFSPLTNEYKVIEVLDDDRFMLNIFTSGKDSSWRPLPHVDLDPLDCPLRRRLYIILGRLCSYVVLRPLCAMHTGELAFVHYQAPLFTHLNKYNF